MPRHRPTPVPVHPDDFRRLPGLFRGWEIPEVLDSGVDLHVEDAGATDDGMPVFAVYRRCVTGSAG